MSHGVDPGVGPIVLVGFMAAGKSTIGARLADRLGWELVDFDDRIHEQTGRTPGALIRERGEAAFRELEAAVTAEVAGVGRRVLAPGGGWVLDPALMDRLGAGAVRVWLRISVDEALRRAEVQDSDRPLLGPADGRRERVADLLREREPLYRKAEIVVNVDEREPEMIVEEILRRLGSSREENER